MTTSDIRPAIPASCAHRPTTGGLVIPAANVQLADGGVDFRARHQATLERCWKGARCQVCDKPTGRPAVLFGGPTQLAAGLFGEPPLCTACALYTTKACPMIAGRQDRFADRQRLSDGRRGRTCPDPDCDCAGWTGHDTDSGHAGQRSHAWYAVYIDPRGYAISVHNEEIVCSDLGCRHVRQVVNGGQLTAPPLKVFQVSEPGAGRIWRRLTAGEAAALLPDDYQIQERARIA